MINYGLCCLFKKENISFKTYNLAKINDDNKEKIIEILNINISSLEKAIKYCKENNINSYRFSSDLIPHFYETRELIKEEMEDILNKISLIETFDIKISCHPGQHINIGSPTEKVVSSSIKDLIYHSIICEKLKAKEINIHLGGTYGNKEEAKERFIKEYKKKQS